MCGAAAWIAHVVQAIEHGDKIERTALDRLGGPGLKLHAVRYAMCLGVRLGLRDGGFVKIVAGEMRLGKGLRH